MGSPTDIAGKVFEVFTSLDSKQKCLVEVINDTGSTLKRMSDEHSSGGFATLPEDEIAPNRADAFVSHDTGFLRGAVGQVTYGVFPEGATTPQGTWTIKWSIPEVGTPSSSGDMAGLDPATFVSRARIGDGNETEAKFELEGPGGGGGTKKKETPDAGLKSTVLIEVRNRTDVPLTLLDQGHDHGGFVTQPALEIPAGDSDSFASFETDRGAPGSKGFLKYQVGDDCEWTIGWDNPESADNTSESTLDGAGAAGFLALDQIGAGEENVPAVYTISRRRGGGRKPETAEDFVDVAISNQSSEPLFLLDSGSFTGRFQSEVAQQIPPGEAFAFTSSETEDKRTGCSGFVRYHVGEAGGALWTLLWDNPEEGENTSSASLDGPAAGSFSSASEITPDKHAAAALFTITGGGTDEPEFAPPGETDEPTLRLGDQSVDGWVEYLQMRLNTLGYGPLPVDGNFDNAVRAAVVAFQGDQRPPLLVDGVVGNQTWAALREEDPRPPSTDGREPHTYVEQGAEARFFTEDSAIDYFAEQDQLLITAANTGDEPLHPGQFEVTARITFPDGEQHTFAVPLTNGGQPSLPGNLVFFETSLGRRLDPGSYLIEAYLPAELGGDQTAREVVVR
ncbi:MAG TPA: peptidoglycan-binding domain-containing protein [Actinophytocola sp.]|uniref:peptidoglycan-binding domain-containing protein n=1 Tax=Actinophytocola sp. TaxID=1872138 RepID=UPI002DBE22D9|nr:peptidoglycan-binding domain-containing protein [Actinophytocola sp.]HEU5470687.1 peptidoglycan-binding domain-containing protein [Actinophytocola sp.]